LKQEKCLGQNALTFQRIAVPMNIMEKRSKSSPLDWNIRLLGNDTARLTFMKWFLDLPVAFELDERLETLSLSSNLKTSELWRAIQTIARQMQVVLVPQDR
jgi:hypothetical protein